ncbi:hypothetical protein SUDANB23_06570 (plasmid) [Streptomyces sp. enrichment culture]
MDHRFQTEQRGTTAFDPMLEGYTALGFLAAQVQDLSLGLLVTGVTFRLPGLLAKTVTTLDVLVGGHTMPGIGAAWYEREHYGPSHPYPNALSAWKKPCRSAGRCGVTTPARAQGTTTGSLKRSARRPLSSRRDRPS